jgi:hypothetical protein
MLFADDVVDAFASARLGCLVLVFVPEHDRFEQVMRLLQVKLVDSEELFVDLCLFGLFWVDTDGDWLNNLFSDF